jgi:hypothetical protein
VTWRTLEEADKEVQETIHGALRYAYLSCGIEFQREQVAKLKSLEVRTSAVREAFIQQSNEPFANTAFRVHMAVRGIKEYMEMWVLLKEDKAAEAWDKLADAQMALVIAQRIQLAPDTDALLRQFLAAEKVLFPYQMGCSNGYTYEEATCSICGEKYGECNHVNSNIYMGRICRRAIKKWSLKERSLVTNPADKRCRVSEYSENGKFYCTLTRREVSQREPVDPDAKIVTCITQRFD